MPFFDCVISPEAWSGPDIDSVACIARHSRIKMLVLRFLLLIGVMRVAEGFGQHIPREWYRFLAVCGSAEH